MSSLLQKMMVALGRRGVQTPIDASLGEAYRALQGCQRAYPGVFAQAAEILLAEVEGGATGVSDVPKRISHLAQMLDRLHREEELEAWAEEEEVIVV